MKQGEKASNSDRFRSHDKHNPYVDVSNQQVVEAKQQRLSLPNMAQKYDDNGYTSQGGVKANDKNTSYLNLPGQPQNSSGVAYPFHGCATNSTEGLSFNSPRATERVCGYDEVEEIEKSHLNAGQGQHVEEGSAAAGLFMGGHDDQEQFKIYNEQIASIEYVDQAQLASHRASGRVKASKPAKDQPAAPKAPKNKPVAANEKPVTKKKKPKKNDQAALALDMQPLSA